MDLSKFDYTKVKSLYSKYFSTCFLNINLEHKLALIAMICYVTNALNKKRNKSINCYQVICKIGKDLPDHIHQDFFKVLGAICDDFMYGCTEFPTFGIDPKVMPKEIESMLKNWIPF